MIKVGKYTAALLLVTAGTLLFFDLLLETDYLDTALNWWPVILIGVGIEYLVLGAVHRNAEQKIGLAFGSLILSIVLSIAAIGFTNGSSFTSVDIQIGPLGFADENGLKYTLAPVQTELVSGIDKVYMKNPNGNVIVKSGDVAVIQIETTLYVPKSKKDEAGEIANGSTVQVTENGGTLEIVSVGKTYRVFGIRQKPRMNLTVTVPRERAVNYELDLTNGKAEVDGIPVQELIKVDTTNGNVVVRNIVGDVFADTTNGSITVSDIEGNAAADTTNGKIVMERITGVVRTDTTNGSIKLTDVENAVTADTTNGAVTIRTQRLGGDWKLDTTNGKIEIYLPENASFEMDGETSRMSSITSDFPLNVNKDEVTGSVNGGQYRINIDTHSGIGIYQNK